MVTASDDGTARVWDTESPRMLQKLEAGNVRVSCVAFDDTGDRVATADESGAVIVWNVTSGQRIATIAAHQKKPKHVEFSADGKEILSASIDGTARLWEAETGKPSKTFSTSLPLEDASLNWNKSRVVTLSEDGLLTLWDVASEAVIINIPLRVSQGVSAKFSSDGSRIVVTGGSGEVITLSR